MDIIKGFNEDGSPRILKQKVHRYSRLPTKGLGKSFDKVLLNEPISITLEEIKSAADLEIWKLSIQNLEKRASELDAYICTQKTFLLDTFSNSITYIWFSKK